MCFSAALGIDSFDEDQVQMMEKAERTGDVLFAVWNPYVGELYRRKEVMMGPIENEAEIMEAHWRVAEEI